MSDPKPPRRIYLQWHFDDEGIRRDPADGEVTWCVDKINESDAPYIIDPRYWMPHRAKTTFAFEEEE